MFFSQMLLSVVKCLETSCSISILEMPLGILVFPQSHATKHHPEPSLQMTLLKGWLMWVHTASMLPEPRGLLLPYWTGPE